ncbi:DUF3037 domain-containing protein [Marinilongibacter aquaticus]|nr:DUF3037 domain-containing protein [Marinilongibacter aquaticus]
MFAFADRRANKGKGRIGELSLGERFRWLSATKSAVVQCGKVHPGILNGNPEEKLNQLFEELVA